MPGPEAGSPAPTPDREVLAGVQLVVNQFKEVNKLPPEQRDQARFDLADLAGIAIGGIAELHTRGVIAGNEQIRKALQDEIFNQSDPGYKVFAEKLVVKIEDMVSGNLQDPRVRQGISSLLELSFLVGINQDKYPDLTPRLKAVSDKLNPTTETRRRAPAPSEGRDKRTEELGEEKINPPKLPENTDEQRRLKLFSRMRIDEELQKLSGERTGGLPPPIDKTLEYESSPERGRQISKEIVRLEGLRAAGKKLSKVQWKELDNLYLQHEIHMEVVRIVSLRVEPSERKEPKEDIQTDSNVNLDNLKNKKTGADITPLKQLLDEYNKDGIPDDPDDRSKFLDEISVYFGEARRVGLLRELDRVLYTSWKEVKIGIGRKQNSTQIMPTISQDLQHALSSFLETYNDRRLGGDQAAKRLAGIGELYIQFSKGRFSTAIRNRDVEGITGRPYIENEFCLSKEEDDNAPKETFWRLQHGWYIEVYAQTKEEFMIAADSYISRLESITSDAKKITQEATQFTDVLAKSEGAKKLSETDPFFIGKLILAIEARVGVFGADNANDRYNGEDYKAFLEFINKDAKGPERWLELAQLLEGKVLASLWKLDKDPRWEILFATYGSRGQLAKMSIAQKDRATKQGIYNQAYDMLVEEMMGVQMRNKNDLEQLTQFMPEQKFLSFYDGLYKYDSERKQEDYGDANIKIWNTLKDIPEDELTSEQKKLKKNGAARLGKIQLALRNREKIEDSDKKFYDRAREDAKKAVDVALQIYGAFGEKSKRSGGVFKTDVKVDAESKKYRYFVPIHWAEKLIQFGVTMTKMKYADDAEIWNEWDGYKKWDDKITKKIIEENKKQNQVPFANFKAQYRTAKAEECRDSNIKILKRDGFDAMVVDDNRQQMVLKRPKEDANALDGLARDTSGNVITEEVDVDFYTATHHAYSNWSGHTYWSYQEEHRHLLLSPATFDKAREIKEGKVRPEDADAVAVQLLILDPTLSRIKRFEKGFEDHERKLTMAAVEDSYLTHWEITDELYRAFWPKYGRPPEDIGIYYGLQDSGGYRKTLESMRARIAEDPERFARRGRELLPDLHNPVATLSEYLGQGSNGAIGAINMMGYKMYRLAGTFALDKFSANAEIGGQMADRLVGYKNREGNFVEGLLLKPTNNSDKLKSLVRKMPKDPEGWENTDGVILQEEICYGLMESLDRLKQYEQLFTVMETITRNASGALDLRKVDILTDSKGSALDIRRKLDTPPKIKWTQLSEGLDLRKGEDTCRDDVAKFIIGANETSDAAEERYNKLFNREVIDESKSPNTGTGRHRAKAFHKAFGEFLRDHDRRGGAGLYPEAEIAYQHINDNIVIFDLNGKPVVLDETIWDFISGKFVPT